MNNIVAKMLRRLGKSNKKGKREWNSFNYEEKTEVIADYNKRSESVRKQYSIGKKNAKVSSRKAT